MLNTKLKLTSVLAALTATTALAQTQPTRRPRHPARRGAFRPAGSHSGATAVRLRPLGDEVKNPVDWFSWGGDFRVRNEYFNNALSLGSVPAAAVCPRA